MKIIYNNIVLVEIKDFMEDYWAPITRPILSSRSLPADTKIYENDRGKKKERVILDKEPYSILIQKVKRDWGQPDKDFRRKSRIWILDFYLDDISQVELIWESKRNSAARMLQYITT